ncbi:MFS transporter, SP family, general alpha glucoside:H+ symporter [Colletotrichum abscissum]|uniref:MFS transporter, SP family, general alpha glucoside:H+ symporter n=1 Tax=Colletotrichum abscissum TaxID=1671311 RepID=A0A9P9XI01_9PEZI|nr:MFS transporter, SP family, general alpha glucoside:H+ symporter [Colletotrichum abscissum]KAI3554041.1 MFS transporter, SP family, general alpha glucoside:H+ symporter [Colletotrichum abscissum]KAK1525495.1 MFS transporter, SP family, general alpha glucoside:H+ symporter [Colletotrichum abscissum]
MAASNVTVARGHLDKTDIVSPEFKKMVEDAKASNDADAQLKVREALKKYKAAMFWAMLLSVALIMEGFDGNMMSSFYGQAQFQARFGTYSEKEGKNLIPTQWQTGLSNSSAVSQLLGLVINAWAQDRFGSRKTLMFFMVIMALAIFIPFFSTSLTMLAIGQFACGIPWGVFQTLSTTYASELVPTVLRPYVTAWVCMCWGFGLTISAGILRVVLTVPGDWGWRLPISLQWIWPLPLFIAAYFAPESPWNAVRRGNIEEARKSLHRLRNAHGNNDHEVEITLAYIRYTTELEHAETENANFIDCFKGTNLRRTEINIVVWCAQILCGNAIQGFAILFLQSAGFSVEQSFDLNISLNACFIIGGFICWLLFPHFGRATIYMSGLTFMFFSLIVIGGLGFAHSSAARLAIGIVMIACQLVNVITIGPVAYPIVAETPSGKLRYKTITIGRFSYVCTGIVNNIITPRMISPDDWNWGAKAALFYAGTNLLCNIWCWFRLPETKDRPFGEIDLLFDNKVPARKWKYTNVDQFADNDRHISKEKHDIVTTTTIENA